MSGFSLAPARGASGSSRGAYASQALVETRPYGTPRPRPAITRRRSEFAERVDAVLWPLFVCAALQLPDRGGSPLSHMGLRAWVIFAAPIGVAEVELPLIWAAERRRSAHKRFAFSAFKRALCVAASRVHPSAPAADALCLILEGALAEAPRRLPDAFESDKRACASVAAAFAPALAKVFAFYAGPPSRYERESLSRHAPRADVDRMQQSLSYGGWTAFCATFSLRLGPDALAAIFVDASQVAAADDLGGLNFEEFLDAVVSAALASSHVPDSTAPRRLLAGLRGMRDGLDAAVPRAANAGHERRHGGSMAGGRSVSSNYHLLIEATKEFQAITDAFWAAARRADPRTKTSAALTFAAAAPRSTQKDRIRQSHELHDLMNEVSSARGIDRL
mmetsp:Transcript_27203/g.91441  ORF Transcript_27203/g.91441 Transcript_27203/m.91441 type:complete len:391 (+) Transcript_27203:196-1368(+)